jgi:NAD(P)-dependent dehydrogenase (short-subunit alcohol dehydrogenase family)/acyl carrier protein
MRLDPTVSFLLTGGLGDLGLAMARRLVSRGAQFLVLAGRNRPGPEALAFFAEADAAGARVLPVALDVADEAAVAGLPDLVKKEGMPPVGGVLHLAGVAHGAMLADTSPQLLREVARPKVAGGWNLHRVFAQVPLFVLVSAVPATVGAIGTGAANYAAANAFLDALARYRRSRGAAGSAIGYGPWRQIGMAAREGGLARLEGVGLGSITTQEGLEILERVVEHDVVQLTAARLNWPELMRAFPSTRDVAQLAEFAAAVRPGRAARLARECLEASAERRPAIISGYLRERLAGVLHADHADLGLDRPINRFGLDSLMALELRSRMESELGVVVPLVRLLEGPTLDELTRDIVDLLLERDSASQPTEEFVF